MTQEGHFLKLDEQSVMKLPYYGPWARRIYVVLQEKNEEKIEEIFVQRRDAFTTDLIHTLQRLKKHEISEIRYLCGFDGFIRIFQGEQGEELVGEYMCKSRGSLENFKGKLNLSE